MDGAAFRLRPVHEADSEFIVRLRTDPRVNQYIHVTSRDVAAQRRWLAEYYEREDDYYFIVERRKDGRPEGTIGIPFIDHEAKQAEWGRWILSYGSIAAVESARLIYMVGFDVLGLDLLYCRTLAANEKVLSFHASCGCLTHRRIENHIGSDGQTQDMVEQRMPRQVWERRAGVLEKMAALLGARSSA
jgi:RimJ/RimL family protein N-acetyltransferase